MTSEGRRRRRPRSRGPRRWLRRACPLVAALAVLACLAAVAPVASDHLGTAGGSASLRVLGRVDASTPSDGPLLSVAATIDIGNWTGGSTGPPSFDPLSGEVYVPEFYAHAVTVLRGISVVASVAVPGNPESVLIDPANGFAYVSSSNTSYVAVINGTTVQSEVAVGTCSGGSVFDLRNSFVYTTLPCLGEVAVLNGTSLLATISLPGANASYQTGGSSYDPANGFVYVSDPWNGDLYVVNGTALLATVSLGGFLSAGTFDASTGLLYVTDGTIGTLDIVNGTSLVGNVSFGGSAYGSGYAFRATYDSANGLLYVPFQGGKATNATVAVLNGSTLLSTLDMGPLLAGTSSFGAYGNGTGFVYQTTSESENLGVGAGSLIALAGTTVAGTVNFSSEPVGNVFDSQNGMVYLPTYTPDNITTGLSTSEIVIVRCLVCLGVSVHETGVPAGSSWNLTASNSTTRFAETVGAVAPAAITLRLVDGTYLLAVAAPAGTTITVAPSNATYNASSRELRVGTVLVQPTGKGPVGSPAWLEGLAVGAVAGLAVIGAVVVRRWQLRREAEALVRAMEEAVRGGSSQPGRRGRP